MARAEQPPDPKQCPSCKYPWTSHTSREARACRARLRGEDPDDVTGHAARTEPLEPPPPTEVEVGTRNFEVFDRTAAWPPGRPQTVPCARCGAALPVGRRGRLPSRCQPSCPPGPPLPQSLPQSPPGSPPSPEPITEPVAWSELHVDPFVTLPPFTPAEARNILGCITRAMLDGGLHVPEVPYAVDELWPLHTAFAEAQPRVVRTPIEPGSASTPAEFAASITEAVGLLAGHVPDAHLVALLKHADGPLWRLVEARRLGPYA